MVGDIPVSDLKLDRCFVLSGTKWDGLYFFMSITKSILIHRIVYCIIFSLLQFFLVYLVRLSLSSKSAEDLPYLSLSPPFCFSFVLQRPLAFHINEKTWQLMIAFPVSYVLDTQSMTSYRVFGAA